MPSLLLERIADRFKVLSIPARLALLNQLQIHGEMSVQELVEATGQRQASVSKHLATLCREGLLSRRKEGLFVYYVISDPTLFTICSVLCDHIRVEIEEVE